MTSGLYELGVQQIMGGAIDLENDSISAMLIDTAEYTVNLSTDSAQDDIPDDAQIAEVELTGKTLDGVVFRATDAVFPSVETGQTVNALVIFLDDDHADTSYLIAYIDNAPSFPITTDDTNVTVVWDTGANGIFKL